MKEIQTTHIKPGIVSSDEYYTPKEIIEALGHFDLDPASPKNPRWCTADVMFTKEDDGLKKTWTGRVFLNPPYSQPLFGLFMERMAHHGNGIALVVPKLGSKIFREYVFPFCSALYLLQDRIKFYDQDWIQQKSPICQSLLIAYGNKNVKAICDSGLRGQMLLPIDLKEYSEIER